MAIDEADRLDPVLGPESHQHGPPLLLQRQLGDPAERFAERTEAYVAPASASVPPAVASAEIVTQSAIRRRA